MSGAAKPAPNPACDEFVRALAELRVPGALANHAAICPHCRPLARVSAALRSARPPASAPLMAAELRQSLADYRVSSRAPGAWTRLVALLALATASIGLALLYLPRADLHSASRTVLLSPFIALSAVLLLGLPLYLYRGRTGLGVTARVHWWFVLAAAVAFELVASLQVAGVLGRSAPLAPAPDCLYLGLLVVSVVGSAVFAQRRHTVLLGERAAGALAGSLAGLVALLFLHVHCPSTAAAHLLVVHILPMLIAVGIGSAAGRRCLGA
jgi:Negative regulator of sigma F